MNWTYPVLGLVVVLCGCATSSPPPEVPAQVVPSVSLVVEPLPLVADVDFQAVFFPANFGYSAEAPPDRWTPSPQDVAMAEAGVERCMAARRPKAKRSLARYARQYSGVYRNQHKMLLVRFLDLASFDNLDWRRRSIVVFDSSVGFMELLFDIDTASCEKG